ncbi:SET domain-containing protein [Hesseltinella vesiculosa]|uniref:SET domain-containing protein n=1 Tax=Hesseltinella vesiculosa TaxID=101127 RepID=A0A1X2G950_9FUNG|nr:SET domain-containing protein [Hesseltinella vesiculosa]
MSNDPALDRFLSWIEHHGGKISKISLSQGASGRSGFASETIEPNETFASIPFDLVITETVARRAFPQLNALSSRPVLSWYLARENNNSESIHRPYLDMLPTTIMTPYFFSQDDLVYLSHTNLGTAVRERLVGIRRDFDCILQIIDPAEHVSWDVYLWSYCVFSSRSFPYTLIDPEYTGDSSEVLLPLLDTFNHKPATKITWSRQGTAESGRISFISGDTIPAGNEVFNNYGAKSNEELLLGYGFCLADNEYDYITIKPNISTDPNGPLKLQILKNCNVTSGNLDPLVHYIHHNHIPEAFWKTMRVLIMNTFELEYYATCNDPGQLDWISHRNEFAMTTVCTSLLQSRIFELKRSVLPRENLSSCQHYALIYRDSQQLLYQNALDMVNQRKQQVLSSIKSLLDSRTMPSPPFLRIAHPGQPPPIFNTATTFVPLETATINVDRLLQRDLPFKAFIETFFESVEEELDVVLMLCLIRQLSLKDDSPWYPSLQAAWNAFDSAQEHCQETVMGLQDIYDSLFPQAFEHLETLDRNLFTLEGLVWANHMLSNYSVEFPPSAEPALVIVPY